MARPIGYAGYYPGEKISPKSRSGKRRDDKIDNNFDVTQADFNGWLAALDLPAFVKEQLLKEMQQATAANVFPKKLGASDLLSADRPEEELREAGGSVGIGFNYWDLVTDPEKTLNKFIESARKGVLNLGDLETQKREKAMRVALGLHQNGTEPDVEALAETYAKGYTTRTRFGGRRQEEEFGDPNDMLLRQVDPANLDEALDDNDDMLLRQINPANPNNQIRLSNARRGMQQPNITTPITIAHIKDSAGNEVGKKIAANVALAHRDIKSSFIRDSRVDEVMRNTSGAFTGQLKEILENPAGVSPEQLKFARRYVALDELVKTANGLDSTAGKVVKTCESINFSGAGDLTNTLRELEKKAKRAETLIKFYERGAEALTPEELHLIDSVVQVLGNGPLDTETLRLIKREATQIKKTAKKLGKIAQAEAPQLGVGRIALINRISRAKEKLTGGDYFTNNAERSLLRKMMALTVEGDGNIALQGLVQGTPLEELATKMRIILPVLERHRLNATIDDLQDTLARGKLMQYLWTNRVAPKIKALTPGYYMGRFMKGVHHFGAVINESQIIDANGNPIIPRNPVYRVANKLITRTGLFKNKFKIVIPETGVKIRVTGGTHFRFVENYFSFLKKKPRVLEITQVTGSTVGAIRTMANASQVLQDTRLLQVLLRSRGDISLLSVQELEILRNMLGGEEKLQEFLAQFQAFYRWLRSNASGIIDINNAEQVLALMRALNKYNLDTLRNLGVGITRNFRGFLENIAQKLTAIQQTLFDNALGKVVGKVLGWKAWVSETVAVAITSAIVALTGGTTSFISTALEKVLAWVTRFVLTIGENFVGAIIKGGDYALEKAIDKTSEANFKTFSIVIGIIMGILSSILFAIIFIIIVIISAIAPQDNAKIQPMGGYSGGPGDNGTATTYPPITPGGCFFETKGYLSYPSFGRKEPGTSDEVRSQYITGCAGYNYYGHGTKHYGHCLPNPWRLSPATLVADPCPPCTGGGSPNCNPCANSGFRQIPSDHFGFAADFATAGAPEVYLPLWGEDPSEEQTWSIVETGSLDVGDYITVRRTDETTGMVYTLHMLHLILNGEVKGAPGGTVLKAGDHLGTLFTGINHPHVHVEAMEDNTVIRPDNVFCRDYRVYW